MPRSLRQPGGCQEASVLLAEGPEASPGPFSGGSMLRSETDSPDRPSLPLVSLLSAPRCVVLHTCCLLGPSSFFRAILYLNSTSHNCLPHLYFSTSRARRLRRLILGFLAVICHFYLKRSGLILAEDCSGTNKREAWTTSARRGCTAELITTIG